MMLASGDRSALMRPPRPPDRISSIVSLAGSTTSGEAAATAKNSAKFPIFIGRLCS